MASNSIGSCPVGGSWYSCPDQNPTFFGCCTSDPCNGSGCPSSDLRAAGIGSGSGPDSSSNNGSELPNVSCPVGQWWTCADQTPSFQGCCLSDPCGGSGTGCPDGQLFAAGFDSVLSAAATSSSSKHSSPKTSSPPKTTQTTSATSSRRTLTTSVASSSTGTALLINLTGSPTSASTASATPSRSSSSHAHIPAIAGGAAGGGVFLILLLLGLCLTRRRHRQSRELHKLRSSFLARSPSIAGEPQPTLPYLQTDVENSTPEKPRTYSAYSPDHITPSTYDSAPYSPDQIQQNTYDNPSRVSYPGRPVFGVPHSTRSPDRLSQPSMSGSPSPPPYASENSSPTRQVRVMYSNTIREAGSSAASPGGWGGATVREVPPNDGATEYSLRTRDRVRSTPIIGGIDGDGQRVDSPTVSDIGWRRSQGTVRRPVGSLPYLRVRTVSEGWNQATESGSWSAGGIARGGGNMGRGRGRRRGRVESGDGRRQSYTSWQSLSS